MEQHPIPQQISSYQFRLVGDMTLKQFFEIAGGALVALLVYSTNLYAIIKWPIMIVCVLIGIALAFVPFQERPLEKWIVAFFRSIYSPTLFYWSKTPGNKKYFQNEATNLQTQTAQNYIATKGDESLKKYLSKTNESKQGIFSKLEDAEMGLLSSIGQLFGPGSAPSGEIEIKDTGKPKPFEKSIPETSAPQPKTEIGKNVKMMVEEKPTAVPQATDNIKLSSVTPMTATPAQNQAQQAQFSPEAAPPSPTTVPNTIIGQVLDDKGKIVEGAILEIRDIAGRPVRALKTNKLGHFIIVTPLLNGRYEIITEKEGYKFKNLSFETEGKIISPIIITGSHDIKMVVDEQKSSDQKFVN